jgi:hypothetical protein
LLLSALAASSVVATPVFAQFVPGPNPITGTVGAQALSAGTGTINAGGAISVASGSTVALTMTGTSTLNNNGTIRTLGTGRAIDSNSGAANLTVTNTGLISSVSTDAFRVNTDSAVSLTNSGTIQVTNGGQAIDWAAIVTKSNTLTNQATGIISAVGEDAVRPGQNGSITNAGSITATPTVASGVASGSDGIDLRTEKTVTVTNTGTITGRHGIATDGANVGPSSLTVNNNAGTIQAVNGSGLNVDANTALPSATSVTANVINAFGATIKGGLLAAATEGDGDGIDVDGVLTLTNSGNVLGLGAKGGTNNAEGIAAGGGSITNTSTGQIIGSSLVADAPNGDTSRAGNGILIDDSNGGNAVAATTVTNSGLIQGKTGFAIRMIGTFADTITNNAGGTIRGAGTGAAIQTGAGGDTVTNKGAIISDIGNAIDLEAGNDSLNLFTGSSVTGTIDGGDGTDTVYLTGTGSGTVGFISNVEHLIADGGTWSVDGASVAAGATYEVNNASVSFGGTFILDGTLKTDPASVEFLDLNIGPNASVHASDGDIFDVHGNFNNHSTKNTEWDTRGATLEFTGDGVTSHDLLLTGDDLGANWAGFGKNFAWKELLLDSDDLLNLGSGTGALDLAFYTRIILGALFSGDQITNIFGNGSNIYYDPNAIDNIYLHGRTFNLAGTGGGFLTPIKTPEPASLPILLSGLGLFIWARRLARRSRR